MKAIKSLAGKLLFEATAILMGVSVALAVDGWKDDRNDRKEERRLLHAFHNEMRTDSVLLAAHLQACNQYKAVYARIASQGIRPDSPEQDYDKLISYTDFSPTGNVYREMLNLGSSRIISDDTLRTILILFNTTMKDELDGVADFDKQFVLSRMIPYLEASFPYPYTAGRGGNAEQHKPHFLNLIHTNIQYKTIQSQYMENYGKVQAGILARLRQDIAKLED